MSPNFGFAIRGSPIRRTWGRTFFLLRTTFPETDSPLDILRVLSASSSSHNLMHHDSAQDIQDRAMRFLSPRRTLSSMVETDIEVEKEEKDDALDNDGPLMLLLLGDDE